MKRTWSKINVSKLLVIVGLIIVGCGVKAVWETEWDSPNGLVDEPRAVTTDFDGNVVVFATVSTPYSAEEYGSLFNLLKYNSDGKLLFSLELDPEDEFCFARAVVTDDDGNIYAAGNDHLFKVSPEGKLLWEAVLAPDDVDGTRGRINDIALSKGRVYLTGTTTMVYSIDGEFLFEADNSANSKAWGRKILVDGLGNAFVLSDTRLTKFNNEGSLVWEIGEDAFTALDMAADDRGDIFVAGNVTNDFTVLAKVSSSGQIIWTQEYQHPNNSVIMQTDQRVAVDSDGAAIVTAFAVVQRAYATDELLTIKYQSNGRLVFAKSESGFWANPYGMILNEPDIAIDSENQIYVTGNGKVLAYDARGSKITTFEDKTNFPNYLAVDDDDNVFVTTSSEQNVKTWKFSQP